MRKSIVALFIATYCLSAQGQFFSEAEKASKEEAKPALKTSLPDLEQKKVYIELCSAESMAQSKAVQLHPVQIHHVPEKRALQKKKVIDTQATLFNHYKLEIAEKWGIAEECLSTIETTGKENSGPSGTSKPLPSKHRFISN